MDKYALIGNPVSHSKSPFIHTLFARQTAQLMSYELVKAPLDSFVDSAKTFFAKGGKGCNVTLPFKEQAYDFADLLTKRAQLAGAVNTLKVLDDGSILGDNTDGEGLVQDLLDHNVNIENSRILLLGAGGAAKGVLHPLLAKKPATILIANRTKEKANQLICGAEESTLLFASDLNGIAGQFDLIINSTSASLSFEHPQIAPSVLHSKTVVYDMMYSSGITSSNQWALNNGAALALDGLGMLVAQAAESFTLWRGVRPKSSKVLTKLRRSLME